MKFARFAFAIAAVWGFLSLPPMYFLMDRIGASAPPPITHPEFYYGFVGLALAFQFLFVLIARDPARYRPLIPIAILEKLVFSVPVFLLYARAAVAPSMLVPAGIDLALGVLFAVAWFKTAAAR